MNDSQLIWEAYLTEEGDSYTDKVDRLLGVERRDVHPGLAVMFKEVGDPNDLPAEGNITAAHQLIRALSELQTKEMYANLLVALILIGRVDDARSVFEEHQDDGEFDLQCRIRLHDVRSTLTIERGKRLPDLPKNQIPKLGETVPRNALTTGIHAGKDINNIDIKLMRLWAADECGAAGEYTARCTEWREHSVEKLDSMGLQGTYFLEPLFFFGA